jgi:hypothetical protein
MKNATTYNYHNKSFSPTGGGSLSVVDFRRKNPLHLMIAEKKDWHVKQFILSFT